MAEVVPKPLDEVASKPRRRMLDLLRRSNKPLDVYELAADTGLHISTVRFHLDVLAKAHLITVRTTPRGTPGRPRTVYEVREHEAPPDGYRPLAAALAASMGRTSRARIRRAEKAGRDWATGLVPRAEAAVPPSTAAQQITGLLGEMHFDPELTEAPPGSGDREVRLHACPYRDLVQDHSDVVCSLHLGLIKGVLAQLGMPFASARLVPFVEPHLCLAYLTAEPPAAESGDGGVGT